ncbi:hypothetical protein EV363DRAFT_1170585 [Boletus edulis]|nr:hypothetical protein EV363DRAFT_1170585 [Boletus edulis]
MDVKNSFPRFLLLPPDFIIIISNSLFNCLQGKIFTMVMCGPFLLTDTFFNNNLNLLHIHIDCIIICSFTSCLIAYGLLVVDTITQDLLFQIIVHPSILTVSLGYASTSFTFT